MMKIYQVTIILTLLTMVWGKHLLIETMDDSYGELKGDDYTEDSNARGRGEIPERTTEELPDNGRGNIPNRKK